MKKRFFSFLVASMLFLVCCTTAFAVESRASKTINSYNGGLKAGNNSGEIRISYDVRGNQIADSIGVSSIVIYNSNGLYVTTITGTTGNGLILSDSVTNKGVYTYKGTPGVSYYATITVFAEIGNDYDSRVFTTSVATAPN